MSDKPPTEKEFRDTGYTANAANFPLSEGAFACLCAWNGIAPDRAPKTWRYSPNAFCRDAWERVAALNSERSLAETPPIGHSGPDAPSRISGGLGTAAQHLQNASDRYFDMWGDAIEARPMVPPRVRRGAQG